ncbi:alpha/beta fold hydrolase [Gordonia sp. NPDC003424]
MNTRRSPADYIDTDSQFVPVDDLNVHYKRSGHGPALLLLHGSGSSLQTFDRVAAELGADVDVIRPDLPGFGLTGPRADRDYSLRAFVDTVARFLDAIGVTSAVVCGNSLGGNIAWNLALDHPERVRGLVLVNATGFPDKSLPLSFRLARNPIGRRLMPGLLSPMATARNLRTIVGPGSKNIVDDQLVDRVYAMMTRPGNQQAFIDFANTGQPDRTGQLSEITAPTLVLRSANIDGQHFTERIVGARDKVNTATGHLIPDEDPTWLADCLREFIIQLEDR